MDVSIGTRWEEFVEEAVKSGRFESPSDVVREGLRLVAAREAKLKALRETIDAAIAEGGSYTMAEVDEYLDKQLDQWEAAQARSA